MQAAGLPRSSGSPRIVCVASGKGGVGKTFISTSLAPSPAARHCRPHGVVHRHVAEVPQLHRKVCRRRALLTCHPESLAGRAVLAVGQSWLCVSHDRAATPAFG